MKCATPIVVSAVEKGDNAAPAKPLQHEKDAKSKRAGGHSTNPRRVGEGGSSRNMLLMHCTRNKKECSIEFFLVIAATRRLLTKSSRRKNNFHQHDARKRKESVDDTNESTLEHAYVASQPATTKSRIVMMMRRYNKETLPYGR